MIAAIVAILLFGALPALVPTTVLADTVSYNSENCKTPTGDDVFIALGRYVFRFPADSLLYIQALSPEQARTAPKSPDPSEPEGCPGNPILGSYFTFIYWHRLAALDTNILEEGPQIQTAFTMVSADSKEYPIQTTMEELFYRYCNLPGIQEKLSVGLLACRVRPKLDLPTHSWGAIYRAEPAIYAAPMGRPFVLHCFASLASDSQLCRTEYKLYLNINIHYKFDRRTVPVQSVLGLDKSIRHFIEQAQVTNYRWTNKSATPVEGRGKSR